MQSLRRLARRAAPILLACLFASHDGAHAEMRALLVGVTSYPTLAERFRLAAPRTDVQRMREVLLRRGIAGARIEVLADGVPGAEAPTRSNIMDALDRLARTARAGDVVLVYFSGHGSQVPADRTTAAGRREPDGLHETFLPIDVGRWDGGTRRVENAIVDFELQAAIDRITDRGAFVWGVFDTCHSATLVRGVEGSELRYRHVPPQELHVPRAERRAPARVASVRRDQPDTAAPAGAAPARGARGGSAFFYAAQASELTPELPLPAEDPKRQPRGVFSFVVTSALESGRPMTYRQMAQYVLSQYGAMSVVRATPHFTGSALDEPVLGQHTPPVRQWPLSFDGTPVVSAGSLEGIDRGAVLSIVPGPLSAGDETLGHLQVVDAGPSQALLEPVAYGGKPAPKTTDLEPGQYLRLAYTPPQFVLRVAVDTTGCRSDCPLADAVRHLQARDVAGVDVLWVGRTAAPEILLRQQHERILFLTPLQQADDETKAGAVGIDLVEQGKALEHALLGARIARQLHAMARARNLLRLAARLAGESRTGSVGATLQHVGADRKVRPVSAERVPLLRDGDTLMLTIENNGSKPIDATVLYIDAHHGIGVLFPSRHGESNRLGPGERQTIDDIEIRATTTGIERLLLICVEARPQGESVDLSFLSQDSLTRRRGAGSEDLDAFFDAGFADFRQRGSKWPAAPGTRVVMHVFTLNVQR